MKVQAIQPWDRWTETMDAMTRDGLLLCSLGADGKPNTMAIGWMTGGLAWGRPILAVWVRPSRHTYALLEQVPEFTVNVLPTEYRDAIQYCGAASGRDTDKFARTHLTPVAAQTVRAPVLQEAVLRYECRVVHKNDVMPATLDSGIGAKAYARGDYHRLYFGEVLAVAAVSR